MAVDKLVDSAQLDSDLTDIADAILAKSGGSGPLAFPAGFISEIGDIPSGGSASANLASWLNLQPAFDSSWTVIEFDLISYPAGGILTLANPLGVVPDYICVIKTDITPNDYGGCVGGVNFIGGGSQDTVLNREILLSKDNTLAPYGMFSGLGINLYNFVTSFCVINASQIQFRVGTAKSTTYGFCTGHYKMGLKVVG